VLDTREAKLKIWKFCRFSHFLLDKYLLNLSIARLPSFHDSSQPLPGS